MASHACLVMQLNALKRYLRLQSLPSLQEAFALPDSPHHVASLTGSLQKMQLALPATRLTSQPPPGPTQHTQVSSSSLSAAPVHQHLAERTPTHRSRFQNAADVSIAAGAAGSRGQQGLRSGVGLGKTEWDDSKVEQQLMSCLSSRVGNEQEERYWQEQERFWLEAQQREACKGHLAWYNTL